MATDPYETLGVAKTATADEIRTAYRKLAKKHHPDLNPGNKAAEERFKAISTANDLLSDPAQRARYDAGEIDATGAERPRRPSYSDFADSPRGRRYRPADTGQGGGAEDFSDLFSDFFAQGGMGGRASGPRRGQDSVYGLDVAFLDAVNGATKRITLADGTALDLTVPPGAKDGQVLRLSGRGGPGANGGTPGDILIELAVRPHPFFVRDGDDIRLELPISLREAV
ncbi:MAG TPA: DnaJ domain-containing protein, partial [Acetobacteraceae bacterium]